MNKLTCPSCKSADCRFLDDYRYFKSEDRKYLGDMKVYQCQSCSLGFNSPMPDKAALDLYFKIVYRQSNRPHFKKDPRKAEILLWQKAQYAYMSQFCDFDKLQSIADYGAGYGMLLREIKLHHPDIKMSAYDPDVQSLEYLKSFDIETYDLFKCLDSAESKNKYDLIIASGSIMYDSNPHCFFDFANKNLSEKGKVFLEVPNHVFSDDSYTKRPYDGPVMFYFSIDSLKKLVDVNNLELEHITTTSTELDDALQYRLNQYNAFNQKEESFIAKIMKGFKSKLKMMIPKRIKKAIKALLYDEDLDIAKKLAPFEYGGKRWTIRCIITRNLKSE